MRRFWAWSAGTTAMLAVAMVATLPTPLGAGLWHYHASFLAAIAVAAAAWPFLQRRRVATLAMAGSGAVATATGFAMLYTKQFPYKEWLTWWHGFTSFVLLLAFLVHWLHNHPRLWGFTTRLFATKRPSGVLAAGAWLAVAGVGAWTWGPAGRLHFTGESYLALASWAILGGVALAYGAWLLHRLPAMRARLADPAGRNRARGLVDASLFLSAWGALLTGFALLYFADALRGGDLKYVSKWWHTATSAAFVAFVALHAGFNARLLRAHARRVDEDLRR